MQGKSQYIVIRWDGLNWQGTRFVNGVRCDFAYLEGDDRDDHDAALAQAKFMWPAHIIFGEHDDTPLFPDEAEQAFDDHYANGGTGLADDVWSRIKERA